MLWRAGRPPAREGRDQPRWRNRSASTGLANGATHARLGTIQWRFGRQSGVVVGGFLFVVAPNRHVFFKPARFLNGGKSLGAEYSKSCCLYHATSRFFYARSFRQGGFLRCGAAPRGRSVQLARPKVPGYSGKLMPAFRLLGEQPDGKCRVTHPQDGPSLFCLVSCRATSARPKHSFQPPVPVPMNRCRAVVGPGPAIP